MRQFATWLASKFELSRGAANANMRPMEGLRGFAVFLVFLVHYSTLVQPWIHSSNLLIFAKGIHTIGNSGVDLFFVLSGYLIYGSLLSRPQRFSAFMWRRVERIYPTFLVVLATYILLSLVFPAESKLPLSFWHACVYVVQNVLLLPGIFPITPIITVAWSLSYEMFFYLVIPLAVWGLRLRHQSPAARSVLFAGAAFVTCLVATVYGGPVRVIMFIAGMLLSEAMTSWKSQAPGAAIGASMLFVGLAATCLPIDGPNGQVIKIAVLFIAFFVLCFSCFGHPQGWLALAFTWTPLRWLGNMSYSYYLLHGLALKALFFVLPHVFPASQGTAWHFWLLLPVAFAFTLFPSAILFLWIERPFSLVRGR